MIALHSLNLKSIEHIVEGGGGVHWHSVNAVAAVHNSKGGQPKVGELDVAVLAYQQVLWLQIPVYDALQNGRNV